MACIKSKYQDSNYSIFTEKQSIFSVVNISKALICFIGNSILFSFIINKNLDYSITRYHFNFFQI